MKLIIGSSYFSNIEQLVYLAKADELLIQSKSNYQKQSLRNRAEILSPNGLQKLSVPVKKVSGKKLALDQILIDYKEDWVKDHLGALQAAYSSSPYFLYYQDELKEILQSKPTGLLELNFRCLNWMLEKMEIQKEIGFTTEFQTSCDRDVEFTLSKHHKCQLKLEPYLQVFSDKISFVPNLSGLDLLFNLGPEANTYILNTQL